MTEAAHPRRRALLLSANRGSGALNSPAHRFYAGLNLKL